MILKDLIFFFISFMLIFSNIPQMLQINVIGGLVGNKLVFYPLVAGFIYTAYCQWKYKNVFLHSGKLLKFLMVYLSVTLLSLLLGLYYYPYWDLVTNGPIDQIEKLPKVLAMFQNFGIEPDVKIVTSIWMIVRTFKGLILDTFYSFCGSYMIYCWYKDDWKRGLDVFLKGLSCSLFVIFIYSMIELFYLAGNENAKEMLELITPYFHIIKTNHGWWPPLLWKGQIRSVFAEPSFFSIWAAFAMPFLWHKVITSKIFKWKAIYGTVLVFLTFLVFMTKARTGVALLCGEVMLLSLYTLYIRDKKVLKQFTIVMLCTLVAFWLSNSFINNYINQNQSKPVTVTVSEYVDSNLISITSTTRRSNTARYSSIYANVMIGLDNPILGVGQGLTPAYMPDYFPEMAKNNMEVQNWIKYQKDEGVLKRGIPSFSAYSLKFAETGFVGLILYMFPVVVLLYRLCKGIYKHEYNWNQVMLLISLLGILVSGFSNTLNVTYCYWVLLGLGYSMCFGNIKENN